MSRAQMSLDKAYILDYMGTGKQALERDTPSPQNAHHC